ncbi:MAG: ABC transporter permease [Methylococcaceae bacterium]|nr:ABC transporter permease [Methylococcaceae bacterium]
MVFFWTDSLIFLLIGIALALAWRIRGREHLRRPWRKVARSPSGMVSLVVLLGFLLVGLLDTVHFLPGPAGIGSQQEQFASEPISLFDWWAAPLRTREEKTYSAPFAIQLYARENVVHEGGSTAWEYPRLLFGGAHLENPERQRVPDILTTAFLGLFKGLLASSLILAGLCTIRSRRSNVRIRDNFKAIAAGRTELPWRAMMLTLILILCISWAIADLSLKYHVFGTDKVGQDVLYQSLKSIRTGLIIGTLTTLIMLPFALALGILAGYYQGWIDDIIQYLYTTLNSIPGVLLIAASILVVQVYMANHEDAFNSVAVRADTRLLFLCLILGITSWTGLCRLLRAETLKLREMEYVQAARALGVKDFMILSRHILPNVFHIVLISVVLDFSGLVLAEAVLSYVNIGVDPTTNSWGNMINSARLEMAREPVVWWSLAAAFVFMFTLVLAANLFADAVRDAFDPRRNNLN